MTLPFAAIASATFRQYFPVNAPFQVSEDNELSELGSAVGVVAGYGPLSASDPKRPHEGTIRHFAVSSKISS